MLMVMLQGFWTTGSMLEVLKPLMWMPYRF